MRLKMIVFNLQVTFLMAPVSVVVPKIRWLRI